MKYTRYSKGNIVQYKFYFAIFTSWYTETSSYIYSLILLIASFKYRKSFKKRAFQTRGFLLK